MTRLALMLLLLLLPTSSHAADSPEFRGPNAKGTYEGPELPTEWGPDKNVVWKQKIPGKGWSSPVIWKGRIYLTTAVPANAKKPEEQSLRALCLDAKDGKVLWETEVFKQDTVTSPRVHSKNSHASPTPVIDGERLYVHFGHEGTAALDLKGKVLWRNTELRYSPVHGNGGSPVLAGERLSLRIDGGDKQMVVGLDPKDGKVAGKTDRRSTSFKRCSCSTPLVLRDGKTELVVSPASDFVAAYDAKSGKELWRVRYPGGGYSVIPQPVTGHGMIFMSTGYETPALFAVKLDGREVAWTLKKGAPHAPSPLLLGDELYSLSDGGILTCVDARSGEV